MKNNGIIFLGFLIICLVNLSAKNKGDHAGAKSPTVASVPAAAPMTPTAQVITPATPVSPTASVGPVASSVGKG